MTSRKVFVTPFKSAAIKYGFKTTISTADSTALGHTNINLAADNPFEGLTGLVFGANAPKPARATKVKATGVVSSFISVDKIGEARSANWTIGSFRYRIPKITRFTEPVVVSHNGIKYGWMLSKKTKQKITAEELTALGITAFTTADAKDTVWGVKNVLPTARKRTGSSDGVEGYTSIQYDPSKTLPAGWSSSAGGKGDPNLGLPG